MLVLILSVIIFIGVSYLLLLQPKVQSFIAKKAIQYAEKTLDTEISASKIEVDIFDGIWFENLLIKDWDCDTLVFAESLEADISKLALLKKDIEINKLEFTKPYIRFYRAKDDLSYNYQYLFEQFSKNSKKPEISSDPLAEEDQLLVDTLITKPKEFEWLLALNQLRLIEPIFLLHDDRKGTFLDVQVNDLDINIEEFDVNKQTVAFESILLDQPNIRYHELPKIKDKKKEKEIVDLDEVIPFSIPGWTMTSPEFLIQKGSFALLTGKDTVRTPDAINFNNLLVENIELDFKDIYFANDSVIGKLDLLAAKEQSGFTINHIKGDLEVSSKHIDIANLDLLTPNSHLSDEFGMKFKSFRGFLDFPNRVKLKANFQDKAFFSLADITYFSAPLLKVPHIQNNRNTKIYISGNISNSISKIRGKDLILKFGDTYIAGDLKMIGLPDIGSTNIIAKIDLLKTNMQGIKNLFPDLKISDNYDKLGDLEFDGRFTGFPSNFVAEGNLKTAVGNVVSDIMVSVSNNVPYYSGDLAVSDFRLGYFTGSEDQLGNISFSTQIEGSGLKLEELKADIKGTVQKIEVRGYTYNDISIDGKIDKKLFSGLVKIDDENVQFVFEGKVDLNNPMPKYQFDAVVDHVDLKELNLISDKQIPGDVKVSGKTSLNLSGDNLDNLAGTAEFENLSFTKDGKPINLKNLKIESSFENNIRNLDLDSDILGANIIGDYTFAGIKNAVQHYLHHFFPFRFPDKKNTTKQDLAFNINIKDPIAVSEAFLPQLQELPKGFIKGKLNTESKLMDLEIDVPSLMIEGTSLNSIFLTANSNREAMNFEAEVDELLINNKTPLPPITLKGSAFDDSIDFSAKMAADTSANRLAIDGNFDVGSDTLQLSLFSTEVVLKNNIWEANTGNFIYKDKNFFLIENILLRQDEKSISLKSRPSRNYNNYTQVIVNNIDVLDFSDIPAIKNLEIEGIISGEVAIKNIFQEPIVAANVEIVELVFLGQNMGYAKAAIKKKDKEDKIKITAIIDDEHYQFNGTGHYHLPDKQNRDGLLDFVLDINSVPLDFLNAFIGDFVSDLEGDGRGQLEIFGNPNEPGFGGKIFIRNGGVTVDYLNTRYNFHNQMIRFDDKYIRFDNIPINDRDKNVASLDGYIFLNDLKNLSLDIKLKSDNFLFLDTKLKHNDSFYGTAYGAGTARFTGPFDRLEMYLNATSNKGTTIYIPSSEETSFSQSGSYSFIDLNTDLSTPDTEKGDGGKRIDLSGMIMDFDFELTPDAEIQIIFDLQAGDIIKGRGYGDIQMNIVTIGDFLFEMYGQYTITEGDYLFTLQNVINKHFTVERGGTVTFNGDPYQAQLNVKAIYGLKAARENLLSQAEAESLETNPAAQDDAKKRVPIDVFLNLTGSLSSPNIEFDINQRNQGITEFDNLIKTKLRELNRNDINELNKQVFGLLVLNQFMPPERLEFDLRSGVNTTVSEFLSNYLSNYLNDAISGVIPDSEFNLNWRNYTSSSDYDGNVDQILNRNEIELMFTKRLFDDRLSIDVGGNIDVGEKLTDDDRVAFAGDFIVVYNISEDGKYQIKAFNKYDYDIFSGDYNKLGISLFVTQEFDKLKDLFKGNKTKKKKKSNSEPINDSSIIPQNEDGLNEEIQNSPTPN